jgi:hypothetical protein
LLAPIVDLLLVALDKTVTTASLRRITPKGPCFRGFRGVGS